LLDELSGIYTAHIELEEQRVFVMAAGALTADELQKIGQEMRERRIIQT
jgi:hypothetical protein